MEITKEQKLFQDVVAKAWEDDAFKKELVANPVATIEKLVGKKIQLPEGKTLVVRDQTDDSVAHIVIPAKPNLDNVELNEEQLEMVAGGNTDLPWYTNILPGQQYLTIKFIEYIAS